MAGTEQHPGTGPEEPDGAGSGSSVGLVVRACSGLAARAMEPKGGSRDRYRQPTEERG